MDHKSESVCAVIGRFIPSDGTDLLILASSSITGQSVARNIHRIFLFRFFFRQRGDILRHYPDVKIWQILIL